MGMFDSFIDKDGREWQTKAFDCALDRWKIGHRVPADSGQDFQVEVIDYLADEKRLVTKFATIRNGVFVSVDDRDLTVPMVDYGGAVLPAGREAW